MTRERPGAAAVDQRADPSPVGLHASSAAELKERLEAERGGVAFLVLRDAEGSQRITHLAGAGRGVTIGRDEAADVTLAWDPEVSGIHAELVPIGNGWALVDDGLSRNGTYVNGERLQGRRRLVDGDSIRFGKTVAVYRLPKPGGVETTRVGSWPPVELTPSQRNVLIALCRPLKTLGAYAPPASNQQIADELFLSVDGVKTHMRALFAKFGVEELPQNQKRARLAQLAVESGLVSDRDL